MGTDLTIRDVNEVAAEPRVADLRLAEALGFERPRAVRQLIERNAAELGGYGEIVSTVERTTDPRGRGRPGVAYWLNEGQALLVCMFSRTERAAAIRRQVIAVFLDWRHDRRPAPPAATIDAFTAMERRLAAVEMAVRLQSDIGNRALSLAVTHLPIWRTGQRPKFWGDVEVREFLTAAHRQMTMVAVRAAAIERFGPARVPSMTALHRYWMRLDQALGGSAKS